MSTLIPIVLAGLLVAGSAAASENPLARHQWRDRVLVVSAPRADDARLLEQKRIFQATRAGMRDRDLVLVEAVGSGPAAAAIRQRLGIADGAFAAVLVGKDGGAKLRSDRPVASEQLFGTVDGMPMRRDEMRRRPAG